MADFCQKMLETFHRTVAERRLAVHIGNLG